MKPALKELLIRMEYEKKLNRLLGDPADKERKITDLFCNNHVCYVKDILIKIKT
jgi:hypothetical protein